MKIMATDLKDLGIIDEIVPEPDGGAHADHEGAAKLLGEVLERQLLVLTQQSPRQIVDSRYEKFRRMCQFFDLGA
jgi:acetyl-CoA carboxylase carboxyl transferase subunit alpha